MYIIANNPWDYVVKQCKSNYGNDLISPSQNSISWSYEKSDAETRKKQLEEYKNKRIAELEAEIWRVKNLF